MANNNFSFITDFLRDSDSQDRLAVAAEQGNDLATEGYGKDLREMSYAGLVAKYGEDVAQNRFRLQDGTNRLRDHRADSSSIPDKIADTALDAAAGLYGISGNTVGALAVKPLAKLAGADPDLAATFNADLTNSLVEQTRSFRSDFANENSRIQGIQAELDADDSFREMADDIEAGASPTIAAWQKIGRDVLSAGSRVVQDPEAIREIIGGSAGSLAPSAALARGAVLAATKGVALLTASARAATIASTSAAALAVGGTEAAGTYADTLTEVMGMSADTLSASPVYAGLLEEGFSPSEARVQLANLTAEEAFVRNLPAAVALGVLTSRFETAPLGVFKGSGLVGGMRTIAAQGGEEAGQGVASALSQNRAIAENADATWDVTTDVGKQAVEGLIGGIGQAGVSAVPATVVGGARSAVNGIVAATTDTNYNDPLRQAVVGGSPVAQAARTADDLFTEVVKGTGRGIAATTQATGKVAAALTPEEKRYNDPLRQDILGQGKIASAVGIAREVVSPIVDRATSRDRKTENKAVEAARDMLEITEAEPTPVAETEQVAVSDAFRSVEDRTFAQRIVDITEVLADKRVKMSDSDAAFAGSQFASLRGKIGGMTGTVRDKAVQLIQSPQAKALDERFRNLDQNKAEVPTKITPNVVAETIALATTHPTNVNPATVKKILEESGEEISPANVKLLKSASKISSIITGRTKAEGAILQTKDVGIAKQSGKPVSNSTSKEETTRSITVAGYVSPDNKKLRSFNDFASDIFQANASPDGTLMITEGPSAGGTVSADSIMNEFSNLITHLTNKVGALNESFAQNGPKGTGPTLRFAGLQPGKGIIPADKWTGNGVFYHRSSPASAATAKQVAADLVAGAAVFNELIDAFPDKFGHLEKVTPVQLSQDTDGYIELDALKAEIDAQEAADIEKANQDLIQRQLLDIPDEVVNRALSRNPNKGIPKIRKTPFTDMIINMFGPFDPTGPVGIELKSHDIIPKNHKRWFRKNGAKYVDNFPASEAEDYQFLVPLDDTENYLDPQGIIDAIVLEANGTPLSDFTQQEAEAARESVAEIQELIEATGQEAGDVRKKIEVLEEIPAQQDLNLVGGKGEKPKKKKNPTVLDEEVLPQAQTTEEQNQNVSDVQESDNTPDSLDDTPLVDDSGKDPSLDIDQKTDTIVDDNGNPMKFYHGTNTDFTEFNDGSIFLTTRKGLAREHARRGEGGTPRLIEATAALGNPLTQEISKDEDPDTYWLKNSLKIEQLKEEGGYDSIMIFNDNEGLIIADRNDQVTIINQDFDRNQESNDDQELSDENLEQLQEVEDDTADLHETFDHAYQEDDSNSAPKNLDDYLEKVENSDTMNKSTVAFAKKLIRPMIRAMNKRIKNKKVSIDGKQVLLTDAIKNGDVQTYRPYRNTAIINKETGEYDQNMIELAGLAFVDWLASVQARDPNQLDDTLEELGLSVTNLSEEEMEGVLYGVSVAQAKANLAKDILRMWGRKENVDAPLSELVGIAEGIAAEMLTTLDESKSLNLIKIARLPLTLEDGKKVETATIIVKGLEGVQDQLNNVQGENTNLLAREELFDVPKETYSIGKKIPNVPVNHARGNLRLSQLERTAIGNEQDIPHYKTEQRGEVFKALGESALYRILGYVENAELIKNQAYKRSVDGKNLSIVMNVKNAFRILDQLTNGETPVYYPVGVTKTGRHQMQGPNPQTNKVLRALVTPTWGELNLKDQDQMDLFWIGVAQAADLTKIEKGNHADILSAVKENFNMKYREATDMIKEFNKSGVIDGEAFADLIGNVEPQVLAAIESVAMLEDHLESGAETMMTSLSAELDGLTNGAANMMVNLGQGEVTQEDFQNFNRVGFFLGQVGKTVNDYFSARGSKGEKNLDLYEKTSGLAQSNMFAGLKRMKPAQREMTLAAGRFAARFGNFEIIDGQIKMTRNTAKNPMTKVNYGSSVGGVGRGVADDMLIEFYKRIQGIPNNVNLDIYFAYPGIQDDIKILFGDTLPSDLGAGRFEFPQTSIAVFNDKGQLAGGFAKNISDTLGKVLTETTKNVIGDKITELNDMLVFSTNVQAEYVQMIFREKLEQLAEKRALEPNSSVRRNKNTGTAIISDLSRRDYNSVVKELEALSPIFVSDDQTLAVGGFQRKSSDMVLSSNMNDKLNQKSHLPMPESVGVSAIPYLVIGTGDAMVINLVFGSENAPKDVLQVFDGIDVPVTKLKEYGPIINQHVLKAWERDVLSMVTNNFNGFLAKADPDVLELAFQSVQDKNKKSSVKAASASELAAQLDERHRQNAARKAVFKRIPVSVDQMGGSDNGYSRGEEDVSLTKINIDIQRVLDGKKPKLKEVTIELQESTADAVLKGMRLNAVQRKVADILKPFMSETRVIIGSVDQMNQYRLDNFPDDGQVLKASANYDAANNTIFIATTKTDTILHEMVHAATYNKVLAHYEGTDLNDAVTRLEALMEEFLTLENNNTKVLEAKASILRQQAQNNPESKAAAVNEFMAYALANQEVSKVLKDTNTRTTVVIARKVLQLMRRLMGGVPTSMFDNVVFNTKVLNETPIEDVTDEGGSGDNGGNDITAPTGENGRDPFSNFWIDTITKYISENFEDLKGLRRSFRPVQSLADDADAVLDGFRQVGMLANQEQRATFRAIYMVMRSQIKLDPQSTIGLTRIFKHIEENLTPDMFGNDREAPQTYSAVVNSFDGPEAVAVLMALSQTSKKFRDALDQIPDPQGEAQIDGSLNETMQKFGQMFLNKVMGSVDLDNKDVKAIMDELADGIVSLDAQREYAALHAITGTLTKADKYLSGKMSQLSNKVAVTNQEVQRESRSKFRRIMMNSITLGTNLLDKGNTDLTADAAKRATHMSVPFLSLVPIREMVTEIIGTDRLSKKLVAMQDVVNYKISGMRQAYREDLPGIFQNLFNRHPEIQEWSSMHTVFGKSDITRFMNPRNMQQSMQLLEEGARRQTRIQELETALDVNMLPYIAQDAKDKAQQLANSINGKGGGKMLMRNAYAITKNLDGEFQDSMVEVIDELVSVYVLDQMDSEVREATVRLWQEDPKAVTGMVTYLQGLNEAEEAKVGISEQAKLNAYKGFIPNHGDKDTRIIIDTDDNEAALARRGFTKLGSYGGDIDSAFSRSYYVTTTRQGGAYSQGIMQNVQSTYRGVDITTGLTVTGESSGFISDDGQVERYLEILNRQDYVQEDDKETMIPVFDEDGEVMGFERVINPDVYFQHMRQEENLAIQMGAWAGRHVEEALAAEYNRALLDELDSIYQNREVGTDDLFVNLKLTSDPIYRESFMLWPQSTKEYADGLFGGQGPMVLKSQVNLSTGYREFSVADFWTGKTRLPIQLRKTIKNVSTLVLGKKALTILSTGERVGQGAVSTAKDIIVIRSLVVPTANTASNVVQLSTRGVPNKQILSGYKNKLAEIEEYNKNVTERIELEAKLRLAANNSNQRRIIKSKIQVIDDLNAKMSIAPIIEAGAYKNLSEGITDLDVDITTGRFGDIMENMANKLPDTLGNIARMGLVSKSTQIYKVANRATQYGDFIAKSIYYDYLMSDDIDGLTHENAIAKMNEEFVNFSALPGRVRSGLESYGLTWFMAFKIRIAKIAMQQLRENPVRALAVSNLLPDIGSPVNDNIGQVILDDRLDYATGYEMLFDAPGLNPWINFLDG